jgi:hypothetical protein
MKKKIIGISNLNIFEGFSEIFKDQSKAPEVVVRSIGNNPEHTRTIVSQATLLAPQYILDIVRKATKAYPNLSADIVYGAVSIGRHIDQNFHISIVIAATESSIYHFGKIIAAANEARGIPRD